MLKRLWIWFQENQQKRADYWLLMNMRDKDLQDLGISRGEIYQKIYGKCSG